MRIAPYDRRLAIRTVMLTGVTLCIVALIEWITDERGAAAGGTGGQSIGLLPLVPLAASIAVVITLVPARRAGELRALAALGVAPWRARAAPIATAVVLAICAAVAIGVRAIDVSPLFPSAVPATDWRPEKAENGIGFVSARRHARVDPNDDLTHDASLVAPASASLEAPAHARLAAAVAIALTGAALSLWLASPLRRRPLRTIATGAIWGAAQVASFQAAGARVVSTLAVAIPSSVLLAIAAFEHRSGGRLDEEDPWI